MLAAVARIWLGSLQTRVGLSFLTIKQARISSLPISCLVSVYQTPSQLRQLSNYLFSSVVLKTILGAGDQSENLSWLFNAKAGSRQYDAPHATYTFGGIYT